MNDAVLAKAQSVLDDLFYAGRIRIGAEEFAIIVAPKPLGETTMQLAPSRKKLSGATSLFDGLANTRAMAEGGSKLARWALDLVIDGIDGWYLPSRDELELCYRAFKPCTYRNYGCSGDNPSSVPPSYAYGAEEPARTSVEAFRAGGEHAFADEWYWTSTLYQSSGESAWCQLFTTGTQNSYATDLKLRARAVRRVKL